MVDPTAETPACAWRGRPDDALDDAPAEASGGKRAWSVEDWAAIVRHGRS